MCALEKEMDRNIMKPLLIDRYPKSIRVEHYFIKKKPTRLKI